MMGGVASAVAIAGVRKMGPVMKTILG
jgi:hypothetical protein